MVVLFVWSKWIVGSGIVAVPKGQLEGALSNGLSFKQALWHIILPQAYKKMIPPIVSQFVSLIKDTSLATIIMLPEVTYVIRYVKIPYLSKIVGFIIDLIRNLPLLLIIFFTYFALPKIGIHLGVMTSTIFALTIFESAMLAEVIPHFDDANELLYAVLGSQVE
ncbi:ABC transporter permease subunit [Weissella confusa]|uniref:ABC transporter permease subunit n=1 Tax=Weissella confusa TaxID=1583 RepID=A0A923ND70_WEICO|nr:ABC transporter permease subunit [Weissella confusa]